MKPTTAPLRKKVVHSVDTSFSSVEWKAFNIRTRPRRYNGANHQSPCASWSPSQNCTGIQGQAGYEAQTRLRHIGDIRFLVKASSP
ncbi:hypothetical protein HYQ45_008072 [Verticillium longisporum]|uniref:Uncharacterized protein n=1 Tax=Verticillium longisporum TaxID=100787 RepID=A0A8I3APK3_VERLO|nr:hypothetical protein HYQ45_008072 [Verticillium longisporum]